MKLIKGIDLNSNQVKQVLNAFVHRHTKDHKATWAKETSPTQNDKQWLADHAFYFTSKGQLSQAHSQCEPAFMADAA